MHHKKEHLSLANIEFQLLIYLKTNKYKRWQLHFLKDSTASYMPLGFLGSEHGRRDTGIGLRM